MSPWLSFEVKYYAILKNNDFSAPKNKIIYKDFVSYLHWEGYLAVLIEDEHIEYIAGTKIFRTTGKSLIFLYMYDEICDFLHITQ